MQIRNGTARRASRGVTLVELMIVVMIVAILASIAVPSYQQYVLRTNRTDATSALLRIQAAQERFFLQNNRYSSNLSAAPPAGLGIPDVTTSGKYDLAVALTNAAGTAYTATARPRGGQAKDTKCAVFSIDESGRRSARDGGGADVTAECWR
ncbi:MAG: type IV pilin protein [Pseudomonadota bacterium]|jgi:prepilin-type N-terminal cleavage/methylation domain|nr:MAG: pilus assembly protein [Pseudomonadota bacterium]